MSTRATITVADEHDSFDLYQHHDGYPDGPYGLVRYLAMARRLAWDLPRFEAGDFAAAVIAVLKDRGGSTYLTASTEEHGDRAYHYRVEPVREDFSTRVQLTISRPACDPARQDVEIFRGDIQQAVSEFDAIGDTAKQPREYQVLMTAEGALYRAEEEISALCGEHPDPDTEKVYEDIADACRELDRLRLHLEQNDPWAVLGRTDEAFRRLREETGSTSTGLPVVDVKLAMEAHRRFQREMD